MRIYEIEIDEYKRTLDELRESESSAVYSIYVEFYDVTNDFNIPVYRLYNPTQIIDIIFQIEKLFNSFSEKFKPTDQIMVMLRELLDYFES